jgi:hypothetical protein
MNTRARQTDPATSHAAARNAVFFADSHKGRIMAALKEGPRTAFGLSQMTGLTVVQIDRRAVELERAGLIDYIKDEDGNEWAVGGFRVWRAV